MRFVRVTKLFLALLIAMLPDPASDSAGGCARAQDRRIRVFEAARPAQRRALREAQSLTIPQTIVIPETSDFVPSSSLPQVADIAMPADADLHVTLRTDLLSPFVEQETTRSNPVSTQVLEANVQGMQTTTTSIHLTSVDCSSEARLNILAKGTVSSNTVGLTPQARIATLGSHTFDVTKPVFFDGTRFLTKPAYGTLQARQFPQSVSSVASGMPLVGRIGDRIAWNEVYRRMPLSDSIVVQRVADDVLPTVNARVDEQLSELNRTWRSVRSILEQTAQGDPLQWHAASTSNSLMIDVRNPALQSRFAGGELSAALASEEVACVLFTDAGVNRALAHLPLAGRTVSDSDLQNLVQQLQAVRSGSGDVRSLLAGFLNSENRSQPAQLFSIQFASTDPLLLSFADGVVRVSIRFAVKPVSGPAGIMQSVSVDLSGAPDDDGLWSLVASGLKAEPANQGDAPDATTLMINAAGSQILKQQPPVRLPRRIDLSQFHARLPAVRLHRMQSETGQFRISVKSDPAVN
ncbi:MAG: hypothetical protein R3C49_25230 [Planctomycetaceae bacterium]